MPPPPLLGVCVAVLLVSCAPPGTARRIVASTSAQDAAVLPVLDQPSRFRPPACKQGVAARLKSGVVVHYRGSDPSDPQVCLVEWLGHTRRLFMGFWGSGRYRKAPQAERAALRNALMGPVGTRTDFQDTHAALWGRVTVEHVADPMLPLASGPRPSVQLRVVRHDAFGRASVRVSNQWVDRETGILLKRESITVLANDEQQPFTTWRITEIGYQPS